MVKSFSYIELFFEFFKKKLMIQMKSIEHCKEQEKQFISIDFSLPGSNQPHGESIIQEHYGVPFGHRVTLFTNQRNPLEPNIPQTCIVGLHTF